MRVKYFCMLMSVSHTMSAAVYTRLPFDPVKSFTAVAMLGAGPLALVTHPAFAASNVKGLIAAIITKLNNEIAAILLQPESAQRLAAEGAEPRPLSSAAFARVINTEIEKWTRVAREANIRTE